MNEFKMEFGPYLVDKYISFQSHTNPIVTGCAMRHEKDPEKAASNPINMVFLKFSTFSELDEFVADVKKIGWLKESKEAGI
jgi:hypothetical protein